MDSEYAHQSTDTNHTNEDITFVITTESVGRCKCSGHWHFVNCN